MFINHPDHWSLKNSLYLKRPYYFFGVPSPAMLPFPSKEIRPALVICLWGGGNVAAKGCWQIPCMDPVAAGLRRRSPRPKRWSPRPRRSAGSRHGGWSNGGTWTSRALGETTVTWRFWQPKKKHRWGCEKNTGCRATSNQQEDGGSLVGWDFVFNNPGGRLWDVVAKA